MRVVLADAGPLIGLARIQRLQLLRDLFTSVWITEVIAAEACYPGWLCVVRPEPASSDPWKPLNPGVDAGEASAIALALRDQGYYFSDSLIAALLKQVGEAS